MSKSLEILSKLIGTDTMYDLIDRVTDKILSSGSLSDTIGNETQLSVSVSIEGDDVMVGVDLQPEGELKLDADQIDEVGDYVATQVKERGLMIMIKMMDPKADDINCLSNVTIHGERPQV